MWPATFASRLASWNDLRAHAATLAPEAALHAINNWWFSVPWKPYYLHWEDQQEWPDPWELLSDNIYCDVARGLGILYTITLLGRADLTDAELVLTESGHNLVQVNKRKYILNWNKNTIVNTIQDEKIVKLLTQSQIAQQYN